MKVLIPAAGVGTRLKPHTFTLPKPLLHIGGKTILDYLLEPVTELDPEEVRFVIGYKGDMIKEHVEKNYSFNSTFVVQDELLGLHFQDVTHPEDLARNLDLQQQVAAGRFRLDLYYVDNWSLKLDAKILFRTVFKVIARKGISSEGHATSLPFRPGNLRSGARDTDANPDDCAQQGIDAPAPPDVRKRQTL